MEDPYNKYYHSILLLYIIFNIKALASKASATQPSPSYVALTFMSALCCLAADGLIIEAHPSPEKAISDGAQSLELTQFARMMEDLQPYIALCKAERSKLLAAAAR
jgi:3-deoxy-D-manno-octulosonic acid (KDO) 8-phosphate synthase